MNARLKKLKDVGLIEHADSDKNGYWVVNYPQMTMKKALYIKRKKISKIAC
jgi:hypothetical protein